MALQGRRLTTYKSSSLVRTGRPRPSRFERQENIRTSTIAGTSMPLDTEVHWSWSNPLNIIPLALLAMLLFSIIGTVVSLF